MDDSQNLEVPYDYHAAIAMPDWRRRVSSPIGLKTTFPVGDSLLFGLSKLIRDMQDSELRSVLVLAGSRVLIFGLPLIEMALSLDAAEDCGQHLVSSFPERAYLDGEIALSELLPRNRVPPVEEVQLAWLRRIKRMSRWTPLYRMPATLIAPQATAITENDLLRETARKGSVRLAFHHAEGLYHELLRHTDTPGREDLVDQATSLLAELLMSVCTISEFRAGRLRALIESQARLLFCLAVRDLTAARRLRSLPRRVWAGTGGKWPGRVLSLEILRRGGQIVRFDHSAGRGVHRFPAWPAILDLYVSSEFHLATDELAKRLEAQGVNDLMPVDRQCPLIGQNGEPHFKGLRTQRVGSNKGRPRVVYAPGLLRGLLQTVPAQIPDVIYLDWQMRMVEALKRLPVDLACRPHPGGILSKGNHPLADVAPVSDQIFEDLIPEADVFITDQPHSTTFYAALCTDRPVVLIDFGAPFFDDRSAEAVERRCRIIKTNYDERNRPLVDEDELEEAVCGGPERCDPAEFRSLLLGEHA